MSQNLPKDTAGRTLIGFAVMVLAVAVFAIQGWWKRTDLEWARLPTGIEDLDYYSGLGVDDKRDPNLKFWAAPDGLVRSSDKIDKRQDSRMWKLPSPVDSGYPMSVAEYARDATNQFFIYRYEKDELNERTGLPERLYLKVGDDRYASFEAKAQ